MSTTAAASPNTDGPLDVSDLTCYYAPAPPGARLLSYHDITSQPAAVSHNQPWAAWLGLDGGLEQTSPYGSEVNFGGTPSTFSSPTTLSTPSTMSTVLSDSFAVPYRPTFPPLVLDDVTEPSFSFEHAHTWPVQVRGGGGMDVEVCTETKPETRPKTKAKTKTKPKPEVIDLTLSVDDPPKAAHRRSVSGYPQSKTEGKTETERRPRSRSCVDNKSLTPEPAPRKKSAARVRSRSSRRESLQLVLSAGIIKPSRTPEPATRRNRRRSRAATADDDDDYDGLSSGDEDARHRQKGDAKGPGFACPFFKRWPRQHSECMNRKLSRMQDVKQHLGRRHRTSLMYCPRCFAVFSAPKERDEHIREATCPQVPKTSTDSPDEMAARVEESIQRRYIRGQDPAEQWYSMWRVLFDDEAPPGSPYLGTMFSETMGILKDLWRDEGRSILPELMPSKPGGAVAQEDLPNLVMAILNKVQSRLEGEEPGASDEPDYEVIDPQAVDYCIESLPGKDEGGEAVEAGGFQYYSTMGHTEAASSLARPSPMFAPPIPMINIDPCEDVDVDGSEMAMDPPMYDEQQDWLAPPTEGSFTFQELWRYA